MLGLPLILTILVVDSANYHYILIPLAFCVAVSE